MAYDEGLAQRLNEYFEGRYDVEVKKMFGGLCYMVRDHMCVGISGDELMARVGPENYDDCLAEANVREMDFTGKPMRGLVIVSPEGFEEDEALARWVRKCEDFICTLPPKKPKK